MDRTTCDKVIVKSGNSLAVNLTKEFLIVAGQRCIGYTGNKGEAMRMAIDHNRSRPAEWAHVVEVKK